MSVSSMAIQTQDVSVLPTLQRTVFHTPWDVSTLSFCSVEQYFRVSPKIVFFLFVFKRLLSIPKSDAMAWPPLGAHPAMITAQGRWTLNPELEESFTWRHGRSCVTRVGLLQSPEKWKVVRRAHWIWGQKPGTQALWALCVLTLLALYKRAQ